MALDFVIKDNEEAAKVQQLVDFLSEEEENVQECKILRSSLKKPTLRKSRSLKRKVMFKEPVVDNVFGHTIPIKNERPFEVQHGDQAQHLRRRRRR